MSDKIALTMSRAQSNTIIMKCEGQVEGIAIYITHQTQKLIELSYIASNETRKGCGTALIDFIKVQLTDLGCDRIVAWAGHNAKEFFEKLGF